MEETTVDRDPNAMCHERCRGELKAAITSLEKNHDRMELQVAERYGRLEAKMDTMSQTMTAWMLKQENKMGNINGRLIAFALTSGTVGGVLAALTASHF